MDNLQEYQPALTYIIGGGTLFFASLASYFIGVSRKSDPSINGKDKIEILKLEHAEATRQHERGKETEARALENKLKLEEARHTRRMQLAEKLCDLKPVMIEYMTQLKEHAQTPPQISSELMRQRQDYREELVEELKDQADDNSGGIYYDDFTITDENAKDIDRLVDIKYPVPGYQPPRLPAPLERLMKMIDGAEEKGTS